MITRVLLQTPPFRLTHWQFLGASAIVGVAIGYDGQMGLFRKIFATGTVPVIEGEEASFWGMAFPMDLIGYYKAMLILWEITEPSYGDLSGAYYAAQRHVDEDDESAVETVISKIGGSVHTNVMNTPIPTEVITLFLKLLEEGYELELFSLTDEVEAGNLEWTEELASIGVKHPDEIRSRQKAEATIIATYEDYLADYARSHRLTRKCFAMETIESVLIEAVEKGILANHGVDVALGVSIVRKHIAVAAFAGIFGFPNNENWTENATQEGIEAAIKWLQKEFRTIGPWGSPRHSKEDYMRILTDLVKSFEKMPIIYPLLEREEATLTTKLTDQNVESIFKECLFHTEEDAGNGVRSDGITTIAFFHPDRLKSNTQQIADMLEQLPKEFQLNLGGSGASLLTAYLDINGKQWTGFHRVVEMLFLLGLATGRVRYLVEDREMWSTMPGSMPYLVVIDDKQEENK